jgi:hypothetical protein
MLDENSARKLEKYFRNASTTFLKKKTLREYVSNLCKYLELPVPRIVVVRDKDFSVERGMEILAYFSVNSDDHPYIVFYRKGMVRVHIKHEIIHYIQFLQDGLKNFTDPELDEEYEMEAELLQECSEEELKLRMSIRSLVTILSRD